MVSRSMMEYQKHTAANIYQATTFRLSLRVPAVTPAESSETALVDLVDLRKATPLPFPAEALQTALMSVKFLTL